MYQQIRLLLQIVSLICWISNNAHLWIIVWIVGLFHSMCTLMNVM